jgi:hypothetical protein
MPPGRIGGVVGGCELVSAIGFAEKTVKKGLHGPMKMVSFYIGWGGEGPWPSCGALGRTFSETNLH